MYRFILAFFAAGVLFSSCSSSPAVFSPGGMVKYGAGSMDDSSVAGQPAKAAAPSPIQKVKRDEILSQITAHEADLDNKLAAFDYTGAFIAYDAITDILAGVPAGTAKMADIRVKMDKALDLIGFEAVSSPLETVSGTAFKKDFSLRVFVTVQEVKKPLADFDCTVFYPSIAEDGSKVILSQAAKSAADGLVSFTAPIPTVSGKNKVVLSSSWASRDTVLRDSITARKDRGQLAVAFPHLTSSSAKRTPTTISILDFDKNGKPVLSGNISATTLLKPLVQKGFGRIGMADFQKELISGDEASVLKSAKALFGSAVQRFIFGTTHVESIVQGDDLVWTCTFAAEITVWDFVLGSKVYSTVIRDTQTGKTEAAAIDAARKKVSGELLVTDLYYNM